MAVDLLRVSRWTGGSRHDREVVQPSWQDVAQAIRSLNGLDVNDVHILPWRSGRAWLSVGGGPDKFIVSGEDGQGRYPILRTDSEVSEDPIGVVVGGQLGYFPPRHVVSLDEALVAAEAFFVSGGFDVQTAWDFE